MAIDRKEMYGEKFKRVHCCYTNSNAFERRVFISIIEIIFFLNCHVKKEKKIRLLRSLIIGYFNFEEKKFLCKAILFLLLRTFIFLGAIRFRNTVKTITAISNCLAI